MTWQERWHTGDVPDEPVTVAAVADALRHISITGVFYCPSFLRAPWGGTLPAMPDCVWFHAVTSGRCRLDAEGVSYELEPGDLALVPHGTGHRIYAGDPDEFHNIPDLPHEHYSDNYAVLRHGGTGPLTELVCGGLCLEHPIARRLVDSLPPVVHVRAARRSALGTTLDLLAEEVERHAVGSEAVISRLCDIVVIQAIRSWITSSDAASSSWLRAMSDPQLGPALAALHADPASPWTVAKLAARAAMSRSAFAARFREVVGQPVMEYLTDTRMQMAADLLRRGEHTVADVATRVGYESDASFSRTFKRHTGVSPRQRRRAG